jgi:hypothetical protein
VIATLAGQRSKAFCLETAVHELHVDVEYIRMFLLEPNFPLLSFFPIIAHGALDHLTLPADHFTFDRVDACGVVVN